MIRLTLAALRNYASPVIARDNPLIINVIIFGALQPFVWRSLAHQAAKHGLLAALTAEHSHLFMWWILAYMLPAFIAVHFYRQVRADVSPAIPRFIAAERAAASLMFLLSLGALSAPLLVLGAPPAGALALPAAGMLMGGIGGSFTNSGASKLTRGVAVLLYLPVMFIGLTRSGLSTILFLPTPITAGLAVAFTAGLLISLVYRPAYAAAQETSQDAAVDAFADRAAARPPRQNQAAQRIAAFMAWRPAFIPVSPLPSLFGQYLGVPATTLIILVQIILLVTVMTGVGMLAGHQSFAHALHIIAPQALAYAALLTSFSSSQWLLSRGDWPYLFSAGIYGPRKNFALALFRAHRTKTAEQATLTALLVTAAALALRLVTPGQAPALLVIILCLSAGGAYGSAIPLLFGELGGKAATVSCNLIVALATIFVLGVTLEAPHQFLPLALLAALAALALAATLDRLAPIRLARLDWPLETEPEVG
jgi:hypothetical protein